MDEFNNVPVHNFIRKGTSEIATPAPPPTSLPAPVPKPIQIVPAAVHAPPVYAAPPPPAPEPVAFAAPVVGSTLITEAVNLPADVSNFYSNGQSYFALASQGGASTDWYNYPTQSGTVIFDPIGGGPQQDLVGGPGVIAYGGQSLMPSTWYLNPSLNGSIVMNNLLPPPVPTPGVGTLHAFGDGVFYNGDSLMPNTWYLNPALNGEILLDDASGTQLLHSIDANLYYNNELLAKAGDIQDVADWSLYPALASVDFNNFSITGLTDISGDGAASFGTLTTSGLATLESINVTGTLAGPVGGTVAAGINTNTSGILTSGLSTNPAVAATTDSVTTSQILFDICGGTLATDGGGTLLTFNGQAITTGTEGDAANWSSYPAFNDITGVTTEPLVIRAPGSQPLNIIADNNAINSTTGGAYNVTVDKGINIVAAANVDITAQNGSGGNIALNAQPGYQLGTQQIGYGAIQLNAYGSSNQALGLGGKIDINAYSGGLGEYGSATSRVSVSSATIALSAGAIPTLPGTAGSMNIYGQDIVSIVASLAPPILGQYPNTIYLYGDGVPGVAGGIRLSSPAGVQIAGNSDLYATDVYPFTSLGLNLKGRASVPGPAADVTIADCASFAMRNAGTMTGIQSITMTGTGTVSGVQTLTMTGTGGITGVATINGVAYPPPIPPNADWSSYPALTNVDLSANNINNVTTINGVTGQPLTIQNSGAGQLALLDLNGSILVASQFAPTSIAGGTALNLSTNTGNITIDPLALGGTIQMLGDTNIGVAGSPQNLLVTGNSRATADVVSSFGGSTPYSLNTIGSLINTPQQYNYYVAVNGSNSTGTGSVSRPFATVSGALAATVSISDTIPLNINIAPGTYTENPTVTRNNTFLVGNVGVADAVIIGTLTFSPTGTAAISQGMSGVSIVGNVVCADSTSQDCSWYIQHSNITSYGTGAIVENSDGTGNNVVVMYNTVVTQNTTANACVLLNASRLNAIQCQFNNTTTAACVSSNGIGSMSLFGCTLTAAGGATASALVTFINAVGNGTPTSFNLCTFTYTAATAGASKAAFFFNNGGALAGATTIANCSFTLPGAAALIQRPGIGAIAITFGANTSNILTIPAAGGGLTYTYTTSTPLRANTLIDAASSSGASGQYLTAGGGGSLSWASLSASSLGALAATPAATAYQNQLVMFNTATNTLSYDTNAYSCVLVTAPSTNALATTMRGRTYIATSAGAQNLTFTTATLTANDTGFFVMVKNGNATGGGDITIVGATGNVLIHNKTATTSGGVGYLYWTGAALVAY